MKKAIPLLCLLLILLLSACGSENKEKTDSSQEIHPHTFSEHGANATHHYMLCECGEKDDVTKHAFTEDDFCEICGFYIYTSDGYYSFHIPDEHGSIIRQLAFDDHDELVYDWRYEYEYYDDFSSKRIVTYRDDSLLSEQTFQRCKNPENGDIYLSEEIYYAEDGSQEFLVYDEYCNILSVTMIDSAGDVITQDVYTYEFDTDGNCTHETIHTDGALSLEFFYEPDAEGCYYASRIIYYDENGQIESDFLYDAFGNEIG